MVHSFPVTPRLLPVVKHAIQLATEKRKKLNSKLGVVFTDDLPVTNPSTLNSFYRSPQNAGLLSTAFERWLENFHYLIRNKHSLMITTRFENSLLR
eukprot:g49158.t1